MDRPDFAPAGIVMRPAEWLQAVRDWPWLDSLRTLRERLRDDRLGVTAGSLTFTTLLALVPLLTVMLATFSASPVFASFQSALQQFLLQNLVPDSIAKPLMGALGNFAAKAHRLGAVGLVVLGVTALALMLTIDRTLNSIWRVRRPRPIAQRVLVYWAAMTLGPLLLGLSLSATSYALSASRGFVNAPPWGVKLLLDVLEFALMLGALSALFHYVPNTPVRWRHALLGGTFVAVGFEVAKKVLALYVEAMPTFSAVYGTFATLPILLLWIYLGWLVVLLGAVLAAHAPSLQLHLPRLSTLPGARFELALGVLRVLRQSRRDHRRALELVEIAQALKLDPLHVEPVLDLLLEIDWVGRLDEPGAARHVLLCDVEHTPVAPLVDRLLLAPELAASAFRERAGIASMAVAELIDPAPATLARST